MGTYRRVVACPYCGFQLLVHGKSRNRNVKCPHCRGVYPIEKGRGVGR